jgi:CubicO group peptidase (beta-lactamase class C family)
MHRALLALAALIATPAFADEKAAAEYSARTGGVSFLALIGGETTFERYDNGGGGDAAYELASGTKSFSGVIAALAVKDGLLTLDEKAAATLVEWRRDPLKSQITISDILHLTSGVEPAPMGRAPTYRAAVAQPAIAPAGERFDYGPVNFQIFGEIMRRKLRSFESGRFSDAVAYLQARVLDPIGVQPAQWNSGRDGNPTLPSGADLTAREWARFGEFVRKGGVVNGERLVDPDAFAAMFEGSAVNAAYGLGWWVNEKPSEETLAASKTMRQASDLFTHPRRGELPDDLVMAAGAGNQRLYIIPSRQMIVVRQTGRILQGRRGRAFSDVEFLLALCE